jgi:hypothetical protein
MWNQEPLEPQYPELFSFARNKDILVHKFFNLYPTQGLFSLPVSSEAFQQ